MITVEGPCRDRVEALRFGSGTLDYLPKPFSEEGFVDKVSVLLARVGRELKKQG